MASLRLGVVRHHPVLPVLLMVGAVVLWFAWRWGYWVLAAEDRVVEGLTFLCYLAAGVVALRVGLRLRRLRVVLEAVLYVLLALAFFFIAGEEISWGQRQLGFQGPENLVAQNLQGEANLHNVLGRYALHGAYIITGLVGAVVARRLVPHLPRLRRRPWLFAPSRDLAPWFAAVVVYYVWVDYVDPVVAAVISPELVLSQVNRLQEFAELALAGGFLIFVVQALGASAAEPTRPAGSPSSSSR